MEKEILDLARNFAIKEYQTRQKACMNGDPKGFAVIYNKRSKRFTSLSLVSKKLHNLSSNAIHVYSVFSNGALEEPIS